MKEDIMKAINNYKEKIKEVEWVREGEHKRIYCQALMLQLFLKIEQILDNEEKKIKSSGIGQDKVHSES